MRASFVDLYFGSRYLRANPLLGFPWTCGGVHHKRVNIKSAITMMPTMSSCSTAILVAKSKLHIVLL